MVKGLPVNIIDYGADPTGVLDSTTAINNAITFALTFNGEVIFPSGTYKVTDTIKMFCTDAGQGVNLTGQGGGRTANSRATLMWEGNAPTGAIIHLRGANNCVVDNINTYSPNIDTYPFQGAIFVQSGQTFGGPSSSGVQLKNCVVNGGIGTGSYAVKIGDNNLQVSEVFCENIFAQGGYSSNLASYVTQNGFVIGSNNTKDMSFYSCGQIFFVNAGVYYEHGISGWHIWENLGGGFSAYDFYINGNGNLLILGGGSEGSQKFLKQFGGGNNPGTITVKDYQAEELQPADDYFIEMGTCNLSLEGCAFSCLALVTKYIKVNDASLANGPSGSINSLVSVCNWYREASDFIPVWSYGPINTILAGSALAPARVFSTGDKGGFPGTMTRLKTVNGDNPQRFASLSYTDGDWAVTRALPYSSSVLSVATVIQKYTIPYTYLKDASTTASVAFLSVEAKGKVVGVYANVTQAFVLGAATVSLAIGYGGSSNEFLLTKVVSGFTGPIGEADAELGVALANATSVQGGYVNFAATTTITAKFLSSSGNFGISTSTNATAGSVDVYVAVQDFS